MHMNSGLNELPKGSLFFFLGNVPVSRFSVLKYSVCLLYSCKCIKVNYLAYFTIVSGNILK